MLPVLVHGVAYHVDRLMVHLAGFFEFLLKAYFFGFWFLLGGDTFDFAFKLFLALLDGDPHAAFAQGENGFLVFNATLTLMLMQANTLVGNVGHIHAGFKLVDGDFF